MSKTTPQQFRNEYAKPHAAHELDSLFWEATDAWEADLFKNWQQLQVILAKDARIEALERRNKEAAKLMQRQLDDVTARDWMAIHIVDGMREWLAAIAAEEKPPWQTPTKKQQDALKDELDCL
jgi:hypothetical protein